jgi:hypothetical protein
MEDAGAAVGIVIDNSDEAIENVVMTDDGTGAGIRMPSMLISKDDGQKLLDFLKTASVEELKTLSVMASFDIGRPDNRVEYDMWYSSSSDRSLDFITDFAHLDNKFSDSVLFTPHFRFWQCPECDKSFIDKNCFGNGKYCAWDSNHPNLSGRDIILEDLRQRCIYYADYISVSARSKWWDYVKNVHEECYGSVNEDCSRLAHKDLGMNWDKTQGCVVNGFESATGKKIDMENVNTLQDSGV